jgi:hypothetical protein
MNIYEKLQEVNVKLQNTKIKKSGHNKFNNFKYFELADFLPTINDLFKEHKLHHYITFNKENASLVITNSEEMEQQIRVTSPMVEIAMKGANVIQNLGAVETYQRRYLYLSALGIVENDAVDSKEMNKSKKPKKDFVPITERMLDDIKDLLNDDLDRTKRVLGHYNVKSLEELDVVRGLDCFNMLKKGNANK